MRENELLAQIAARAASLGAAFPQVLVGPGDDCAVVATPDGASPRLLLKVDQVVEGRHFYPGTPPDLIARKAIARAVSDIAAMGGSPLALLVGAVLPDGYAHAAALCEAVDRWGRHWSSPVVGGDTSGSAGPLTLSVTAVGLPHPQRGPVLRSGARAGDLVYVTGALGGSFDAATGLGRHLTFEPRLAEARWLCDTLGPNLHAMMDLSDGLGMDSARLAAASGVRIELDASAIPLNPDANHWRSALADGEDHELLLVASPTASVPGVCPVTGTPVTRIGRITEYADGPRCVVIENGRPIDASAMGWEHAAGA